MVTLDDKILNVGTFNGDLKEGRRNYERAKQGSELIITEKSALEKALKEYTGYDDLNLPKDTIETSIRRGDIRFIIKSESRIKRPSYKEAVVGMENYLDGVAFLVAQGTEISGVIQRSKLIFIEVSKLFEAFNIIVGGILNPGVEHTIRYEVTGELAEERPLDELTLRAGRNPEALIEENFVNYVRMDRINPILVAYVSAYDAKLVEGQRKPEKLTPVTTKSAYVTTKSKAEGPDWAYVVKTLVTVPTDPKTVGELNILNDPNLSRIEKGNKLPYYDLTYKRDDPTLLYVSVQSVDQRIQSLKTKTVLEAKRLKVEPIEIV